MLIDTISFELFGHTAHWQENGDVFLHDGFFMLRDFGLRLREFLVSNQPYLLREGRVVLVRRGSARYSFNLVEQHFVAGDLVVFFADTLIEKHGHSSDFTFDAFSFDTQACNLPQLAASLGRTQLYSDGLGSLEATSFVRLHTEGRTADVVSLHFSLLWELVHGQPFPEENVRLLTRSFLLYVAQQQADAPVARALSRQDETLRRFVALVSRHAARQRNIPFYADRLCLAPHYLSTLIKQVSGRTVMQWINETAVKEIKVWLAYSDESVSQISERLRFPCPSSLTKFFKRETGMTPAEYRLGER